MKRIGNTLRPLSALLASTLVLGVGTPLQAQNLDPARMRAIDEALHDRIDTQTDLWFENGDYPKSINSLRAAAAIEPGDYEIVTNLGWMLENILNWDEALATYVRFRRQNPDDPDAAYPEANFYFMKKSYLEIPALLEPSIKMARTPHANSFRILAHAYDRLGLLADSKRVWEKLLSVDPSDEAAKVNLAKVEKKIRGEAVGAPKPDAPPATG